MKIFSLMLLLSFFSLAATAQELPLNRMYMLNGYLLNPAVTASNASNAKVVARQLWVGWEEAPRTLVGSGHWRLGRDKKSGVGGMIYNDKNNAINRFGFQASFGHRVALSNKINMAFGLALSAQQFSLNTSGLYGNDASDPLLTGATESVFGLPDASAGFLIYSAKAYFGASISNAFQSKIKLRTDGASESAVPRSVFLTGGLRNEVNYSIVWEPSVMMLWTQGFPIELHVNTKFRFDDKFWLGGSYRINNALQVMAGFQFLEYELGYVYEYTLSSLNRFNQGSHELMLGINLEYRRPLRRSGAVQCPAFL